MTATNFRGKSNKDQKMHRNEGKNYKKTVMFSITHVSLKFSKDEKGKFYNFK